MIHRQVKLVNLSEAKFTDKYLNAFSDLALKIGVLEEVTMGNIRQAKYRQEL